MTQCLQYKRVWIWGLFIFFVLSFCGIDSGFAQNKELEGFAVKANAGSEIAFQFSATDNKGEIIYNETGKTLIQGNKYRLEVPDNLLLVNNGITRWIYKEQDDELVIAANNPNEEDVLENPFAILKSNGKQVKNYTVSIVNRAAGLGGAQMQGVPDKIILTASGGAKYTIKITGFKSVYNLSGSMFELDVKRYPNAVVTDLR